MRTAPNCFTYYYFTKVAYSTKVALTTNVAYSIKLFFLFSAHILMNEIVISESTNSGIF